MDYIGCLIFLKSEKKFATVSRKCELFRLPTWTAQIMLSPDVDNDAHYIFLNENEILEGLGL